MSQAKVEKGSTRRIFLKNVAAGTGLALLPGSGFGSFSALAAETTTLVVASWGGSYSEALKKAFLDPYEESNPNIKLRLDDPVGYAKLKAMVDSGRVVWDIAVCADDFGLEEHGAWLEPIDYSIIDRNRFLPGYADKYRLGLDVEATVIAYRLDKFKSAPTSFADLFDLDNFPGKRALWKYAPGGLFEAALVADGVAASALYPLDVERALKKLNTIKDQVIWWESGAQSEQLLGSEEATIGLLWNGRAGHAGESAPVAIAWSQWLTQNGFLVIPKGAPNKEAAMHALNAFTQPDRQIAFAELIPYGPTTKEGAVNATGRYKGQLPTDHLDKRVAVDTRWWNANLAAVDARFQEWLLE